MTIGERIKQLREKHQMQIRDLGQASGVFYTLIYRYEKDEHVPEPKTMAKLAGAFGLTLSEFMEGVDNFGS